MKIVNVSIGLSMMFGENIPENPKSKDIFYQKNCSLMELTKVDIDAKTKSEKILFEKPDIDKEKQGSVSDELVFKKFNW